MRMNWKCLGLSTIMFLMASMSSVQAKKAKKKAAKAPRPNIIMVMTDDQGYGDYSGLGNPIVQTPHIDAMAQRSVTVDRFYVSPVCTPTRSSLMTGRYSFRTRAFDTWRGLAMMDTEEVTIAEALGEHGYATAIYGKWHLGDNYPMRPNDQGFDESLVHHGGGLAQPADPIENNARYTNPILFHNGEAINTKGYCTDIYFTEAFKFMAQAQKAKRPFFIYLAPNAPHGPYHDVPMGLLAKYQKMDMKKVHVAETPPTYYGKEPIDDIFARTFAMVENIDENMGRLFAKLDELKLTDNTIVLYFSDNGPQQDRFNGGLRSRKGNIYEGGIRSPLWIQWPARFKAGLKAPTVAAHIDLMPTLLEAASVPAPKGVKFDGHSILPALDGQALDPSLQNRTLFLQWHRGLPRPHENVAVLRGQWKLLRDGRVRHNRKKVVGAKHELYDLSADPGEQRNVAADHPKLVEELKALYDVWFEDVSTTRPHNFETPRIWIGSEHETNTMLTRQDWKAYDEGWGNYGYWKLKSLNERDYEVGLQLRKPAEAGTKITLVGPKERYTKTLQKKARYVTFDRVSFPKGPIDFEVQLEYADKKVPAPWHVFLKQID